MKESIKRLSLSDIDLFENDKDQDFAIAKLEFLASGNNSHKNPISVETLKRCAHTVLGKFVVGEFDKYTKDVTTHTENQVIFGYVPPNSEVEFVEKDDRIFASVKAVMSKLYATDIVQMFRDDNFRHVSVEFTCLTDDEDDEGNAEITDFEIRAITLLGKEVAPSCKDANMQMTQFSEDKALRYFNDIAKSDIDTFVENRMKKMSDKTYKIDTSIESLSDDKWDGDKAKHDILKAKNFKTLAPKIFLQLKQGWEDKNVTDLGYPVMQLKGDTWVYNRKALASAEGYAKTENNTSVLNKVLNIKKKLKIDESEEGEATMKKKFDELEGRELYAKVIELVKEHLGENYYVKSVYDDKVILENDKKEEIEVPADIKVGEDDKDMDIKIDFDKVPKEFAEDEEKSEEKKMDDDDDDDEEKKEVEKVEDDDDAKVDDEEEKQMSLDAMVDMSAYLQMLENETDDYKELARMIATEMADEDKTIVMKRILGMAKECNELKAFKAEKMEEQKAFKVNEVLMQVKEDLSEEEFETFKTQGMECEYSELTAFENTVKAQAYQNAKTSNDKSDEKKEFAKMAFSFDNHIKQTEVSADDIYSRY